MKQPAYAHFLQQQESSIQLTFRSSGEKTLPRKPTLRSLTYRKKNSAFDGLIKLEIYRIK